MKKTVEKKDKRIRRLSEKFSKICDCPLARKRIIPILDDYHSLLEEELSEKEILKIQDCVIRELEECINRYIPNQAEH